MPPQDQQTPTAPANNTDITSVLDSLQVDKSIKASAWDAYHASRSPEEFQRKFNTIAIPKQAKAAMWDLKFAPKMTEQSEHARQVKGGEKSSTRIEDALPTAGAVVGGTLGAPGGPATGVFGAGLGSAAGEATRQLVKRFVRGKGAPETSADAAHGIVNEFAIGAGTELGGRIAAKPFEAMAGKFARTAARGTRVPMLPSEAGVGGEAAKTVEGFLEHALPSSGAMKRFRATQLGKAEAVVSEEIGRISQFQGTPEQVGIETQKAISAGRGRLKQEVDAAYQAIDQMTESAVKRVPQTETVTTPILDEFGKPMSFDKNVLRKAEVGGVQPETIEVKKRAIMLLREIQQQEKLMDPKLLADTKSMLEQIVRAPKRVPYETMARSRSDLLALGRRLDEALPGKRAGMAKLLASTIDDSMQRAAENSGISGLPEQVRAANGLTREMHRKFEQDLITKIMDSKKPEMITGYVKSSGEQELRDMNEVIKPAERKMIQSQVVQDALTEAKTDGKFDPRKFAKTIQQFGDNRGQILFGQNWDSVRQVGDLMGRIGGSGKTGMASSLHNWAYMGAAIAAGTGHVTPLAAMAPEAAFLHGLAKAITNPAKSAKVLSYMAMAAHGAPYAVNGLIHYVTEDEEPSDEQLTRTHSKTARELSDSVGAKPGQKVKALKDIQKRYQPSQ